VAYTPLGVPHPIPPQGWRPVPPPVAPNGQPLAGFGDRFLAYLIDVLILGAISMIWTIPLLIWWFSSMFSAMSRDFDRLEQNPGARPELVLSFTDFWLPYLAFFLASLIFGMLLSYAYFVEYQIRKGQTVGKRTMKLRIIPADPSAILTRTDLVKRWAVERVVAAFVPMFSLLDGLWQLWDKPLQQCLHDKAAGTVVVKTG
jgi:uncharacterized RDD family membrane protein YckC